MKRQFIFVILTAVLLLTVACEGNNPAPIIIDAETPLILTQPQNDGYAAGADPEDVTALSAGVKTPGDGGVLSYQWYQASDAGAETTGSLVGVGVTYKPEIPASITNATELFYYYVVVTNTNNKVNGEKTAAARSSTAIITVTKAIDIVNAETPEIQTHPVGGATYQDGTAAANVAELSVSVKPLGDDGRLSYQWYKADSAEPTAIGTLVGTGDTYKPEIPASITSLKDYLYYYVVVTNTNESVNGEKTAAARSNTATITVTKNLQNQLPLTFKVNASGNFTGLIGGVEVPAVLRGDASVEAARRPEAGIVSDIKVLHTNSSGYAELGDIVGMALKTQDAWAIETYVFLDSAMTIGDGNVSPQIFGMGITETGTASGLGIWASINGANGRFQIRPNGWNGGFNIANTNLYTNSTTRDFKGQWRHFVFTIDDGASRQMNIYMDGELISGFITGGEAKPWLKTSDLALMQVAYLGKPYIWGTTGNANNEHLTTNSQYHSFTVHSGYKSASDVTAMVDQALLDKLNGLHGIALQGLSSTLQEGAETAAGAVIASITAQGASPITFALVSGGGDADNTKFTIDGNQLKVGSAALVAGDYTIRIKATDSNSASAEKIFTFTVNSSVVTLPAPKLQFTFAAADGTDVAAAIGNVTGKLEGTTTIGTEKGMGILKIGTGLTSYFDLSEDAANIINNATEYTVSTYIHLTYTGLSQGLNFWTFIHTDYNTCFGNGNVDANRSLTALTSFNRRLRASNASPDDARSILQTWQAANVGDALANPDKYPASGKWNHLMVTHTGRTLKIFLNGVELAATYDTSAETNNGGTSVTPDSSEIDGLAYAWLGGKYTVGQINNGGWTNNYMENNKYADFRIYDKALSALEIEKLKTDEIDVTLATLNN